MHENLNMVNKLLPSDGEARLPGLEMGATLAALRDQIEKASAGSIAPNVTLAQHAGTQRASEVAIFRTDYSILQRRMPILRALSTRLALIPLPGQAMTALGKAASISSFRRKGAAFWNLAQSGRKAICVTLRLRAQSVAICSPPVGLPPCNRTMSGYLASTLSSTLQIRWWS